ncbi:hypothetical protein [Rhizobium metallidurans]|uniref:Uncharacterized protein n=1 Tax=Rhizobium metallidurans TaxID=1265931 RepID=A0A7W6CSG1_9HYPH|nr:hypothetical protein [Rhizobium metallidurans]MBB3964132.1 hypothetical protein [Rhizobium metallidurans]
MAQADQSLLGITGQTLDFALKVLQLGALGLGGLVIVLSFLIILVRTTMGGQITDAQRAVFNSFMLLGAFSMTIAFACLLGEKYIPSRANVSLAFSPRFQTIGVPVPVIKYGEATYEENRSFLIHDTGTIIVSVDDTFDKYKQLQEAKSIAENKAAAAAAVIKATDVKIGSTMQTISDQQQKIQEIVGAVKPEVVAKLPPNVPENFKAITKSNSSSIEQLGNIRESLQSKF